MLPQLANSDNHSDAILRAIFAVGQRLEAVARDVAEIRNIVTSTRTDKEWYSTTELADALGKSQFTIQERWCNERRIECEKDPDSNKWRIPGHEYRRLIGGGALKPKQR